MMIELQRRKCMMCGHEFKYMLGGFILRMPVCPHCGAIFSRRVDKNGLIANLSDKINKFVSSYRQSTP